MLIITIYLTIGILVNFTGILAKIANNRLKRLKGYSNKELFIEKAYISILKNIVVEIILRLVIVMFFPFLYLFIFLNYSRYRILLRMDDNLLYFMKMGGAGTIICNNCNFSQDIISFLHGFGPNSWNNSGFQCQKCGKFHEIECDTNNSNGKLCECGGYLSKNKPLFCPNCKSKSVKYDMRYIT